MPSFSYTARTKQGTVQQGVLSADDRSAAAASILETGLVPILVKEAGPTGAIGGFNLSKLLKHKAHVKAADKVVFSRQLATMVNAGVPIVQSLSILADQTTSKTLKEAVRDVAKKVEGGTTLGNALSEHPEIFPPIYINMVRAGETGGILDEVLDRLATQQEKDAEIVRKVRGAMIYPSVIVTITVAAFFFLMTVIVPRMATIFEGFGTTLPIYTRIMLGFSKILTHYILFVIAGIVVAAVLLVRYYHTKPGRRMFDALILRTPILGPIVRKVNVARFARTFSSLMSSGIAILDALNATANALGNTVYKEELQQIAQQVKNGKSISQPLKASKNFPAIVSQMVMVGEETGQLAEILMKLAEFYEKEVDQVISNITSIIEPVLIVVIGGMVGSIVISILGPLGSLTGSVGG